MKIKPGNGTGAPRWRRAFSLLEVMLAIGIFFIAIFAILEMMSSWLNAARALQDSQVDASDLAAQLVVTNRLEEGSESGDFGDLHPGYQWTRDTTLIGTNGLFRVDFRVRSGRKEWPIDPTLSIILWRPDSPLQAGPRGARTSSLR